jgi:vitamin K-dependent gamma-carboxylase-like protein
LRGVSLWRPTAVAGQPRFDVGALIEIDLRSLALFRIGVAITVLVDLVSRVRDLDALYGAGGVLPPELARTLWDARVAASVFTWVAPWPSLLWAGAIALAIAAACLALGLAPRLSAVAAWVLLAALQDRNPGLYMSGDRYLLLLLMWCILLPTGARLSLRPASPGVTRIRSWAGAGLLLQIVLVYVLTGLKKTGGEWLDGTALWYALNQEQYVTAAGQWLRSQTALIGALSRVIKWVEIFGPLLVLSPVRNAAARAMAVGLFWTMHLGLHAFQAIGVFQLVGLAAWSVFLPSALWDWLVPGESSGAEGTSRADQRIQPAPWSERLALVPLAYLIIVIVYTGTGLVVRGTPHYPVPAGVDRVATFLHLQEGWAMFATVGPYHTWYLAPGRLADGSDVEVLRRAPLDWTRPLDVQSAQRGFRWTLYLGNAVRRGLVDPPFQATYSPLLDYLCRDWNAHHGSERRLEHVSLVVTAEIIGGPGSEGNGPRGRHEFAAYDCPPAP